MKKIVVVGNFKPPMTGAKKILYGVSNMGSYATVHDKSLILLVSLFFREFEVIYFNLYRTRKSFLINIIVILIGTLRCKRLVAHVHGNDLELFLGKLSFLEKVLVKICVSKLSTVIFLSDRHKETWLNLFAKTSQILKVVYNGGEGVKGVYAKGLLNKSKLKFVYTSNIMTEKGVFEFINFAENYPNDQFDIYGQVMLVDEELILFHNRISSLENVNFKGVYRNLDFLKDYDCLLFPSRYPTEAVPLCILEAWNNGLAIISSDIGFIKEYFGKKILFFRKHGNKLDYDRALLLDHISNRGGTSICPFLAEKCYLDVCNILEDLD